MVALNFTTEYVTVADADEYHESRGNSAWVNFSESPVEDLKEQAIRRGTDFIIGRYNGRWIDEPDGSDLDEEIIYAICEAALRELATPGILSPDLERGGEIQSIRAGSVGITYSDRASALTTITKIEDLLRGLVMSSGTVRLIRA